MDKKDFKEFLFCVVGKRQRLDLRARTKPLCPEVLCSIVITYGIQLINKSGLLRIIGQKAEEDYIRKYYAKKRIISPWDIEPKSYIISKEMKKIVDMVNSTGSSLLGWIVVNLAAANSTSANLDITSLLRRMEQKMTSLEQKVSGLDIKLGKMNPVITYMSAVFDYIIEKTQINTEDIPRSSI